MNLFLNPLDEHPCLLRLKKSETTKYFKKLKKASFIKKLLKFVTLKSLKSTLKNYSMAITKLSVTYYQTS